MLDADVGHETFWCHHNGVRAWRQKSFGAALHERGFEQKRDRARHWQTIKLLKAVADFEHSHTESAEPPADDDEVPF